MTRLGEYAASRDLFVNLTLRELRTRYRKSVLGWTWSLLNPLSSVIIFTIVFSFFLKIVPPTGDPSGLKSFPLFLLCAFVAWNLFTNGLTGCMNSLLENANLIKKVYFPRELLVASTIASLVVTMVIEIGVLSVILLIEGNMVLPWVPVVLLLIVLEVAFVLGIGLILATWNVYFRDVKHLVNIALTILFYSAPIVYPIRFVPDRAIVLGHSLPIGDIYRLNPLVTIVTVFRSVLYDLRFPDLGDLAYLSLWSVGMLLLGLWVFGRLDRRLAEEV